MAFAPLHSKSLISATVPSRVTMSHRNITIICYYCKLLLTLTQQNENRCKEQSPCHLLQLMFKSYHVTVFHLQSAMLIEDTLCCKCNAVSQQRHFTGISANNIRLQCGHIFSHFFGMRSLGCFAFQGKRDDPPFQGKRGEIGSLLLLGILHF